MTLVRNLRCIYPPVTLLLLLFFHVAVTNAQIRVTDDLQRTLQLTTPASRIVSLAPSLTETLFAIGAGDQLVGVTNYCNYPAEAKTKQRVGGVVNPNIETIVGVKPDLIVLSMEGNVREDFNTLTGLGIPVFVSNPRNLRGIYTSIQQMGIVTGKEASASRLVKSLQRREAAITKAVRTSKKKRATLVFVSLQPIIVVGKGTFFAELVELAGGVNAASKAASTYPAYSREAVLKDNPDVLIFLSDVVADPAKLVTLYPEWSRINAFRTKQVFRIDADIVSRPGPRAVDGLEALHKLFHEETK